MHKESIQFFVGQGNLKDNKICQVLHLGKEEYFRIKAETVNSLEWQKDGTRCFISIFPVNHWRVLRCICFWRVGEGDGGGHGGITRLDFHFTKYLSDSMNVLGKSDWNLSLGGQN